MKPSTIIDLTATLTKGQRGVDYEPARTVERDGWNARTLNLYSHAGTHMDAQLHFAAGIESIDQIPMERLMGPAWRINLTDLVTKKMLITPNHLGRAKEELLPGESLILHTGWSRYKDNDDTFRLQLPRVSEELALWCVERKVNILGVEPPSIADVANIKEVTQIHTILLEANVTIVEGLCNLELCPERIFFAAFPLKIHQGDGAPCRAVAWPLETNTSK
ncbi:MAG: cyclase family protein [Coraliomargaritaceae bacterium]